MSCKSHPPVLFYAAASRTIGMGHLMRCRAIAEELHARNIGCVMLGPDRQLMSIQDDHLFEHWLDEGARHQGDQQRAQNIVDVMQQFDAQWLIVDQPGAIVPIFQNVLASHCIKWLQFDGRCNRNLQAKWVVNQQPHVTPDDYSRAQGIESQSILIGPSYAPVRKAFSDKWHFRPELRRIVAIFGGGDDRGMHELMIQALGGSDPDYQVILVCGRENPRNKALDGMCQHLSNIDVVIDPANLQALFISADLVITAGGTTTYELAALGVPMAIISVVDNQVAQSRAWAAMGAALYLGASEGVDALMVCRVVGQLARAPAERRRLGESAHLKCDGRGAGRIIDALLEDYLTTPEGD